ncbi:Ketosamine-3-kinase [Coccomyxa subellipsoidea C-169]|uniref:protein-ribulosamine 3-kinase n=1 Tax=Coccomyxa subellipsoidea (strain C-169) TaxID=574566 RepID=I0YZN4_COCSC|nr:Ketosamine-3-kinase [Coccomyxa subellipsoidea C-169]EIE23853.1 Ketosamine-3-kinase [Coccomyxa subellipsoidea C-169]|eukprot:XP_005648397.1 Ketosamine-3-kinase [Coccomyxa subellipsoidea C-169]
MVSSSSWSSAYVYTTDGGKKLFVKQSSNGGEGMFKGEALGLQAMYGSGLRGGEATFIIMEHLNFSGRPSQADLGRKLAHMHLAEPSDENARDGKFGFAVDNTIGGTPQPNGWLGDWVNFFRERRLRHQLSLANDKRLSEMGEQLMANLEQLFEGVEVKPSLLHGDLWSGNISAVEGGEWSILDPATYYGHHEAEFGMQWCAGFTGDFWQAYHEVIPRSPGFEDRKQLYMLYHYLNHYNLFGGGYRSSAESILRQLTRKYA